MSEKTKILSTDGAWESGELGESEKSARVADSAIKNRVDDALGLQMISIRLEKKLIDSFKVLGDFHGVGYQPLMRDALKRFAESEMKAIVSGWVESQKKEASQPRRATSTKPAAPRMKRAA